MVWVIFALMLGVAASCALWPLARARKRRPRSDLDVAFYRRQLAEVDRDASQGLLAPGEVAFARTEVARRLLAASDEGQPDQTSAAGVAVPRRRGLAACFALIAIPFVALGLYGRLGSPGLPDQPLNARLAAAPAEMDVAVAVARIEAHLATHPEDGNGYEIVAPVYLRLGRADDAVKAYAKALALLGETPERRENYGEALVVAAGGIVTAEARATFEAVLADNPSRPRSRYYLGLGAEQAGDKTRAIQIFSKLLEEGAGMAWAPAVRDRLEALRAEALPKAPPADAAAAIASLAPADRDAAIRGMVENLAARLAHDRHDVAGWLRLVRAYSVLNDSGKARVALADARRWLADDPDALTRLDGIARELGLGESRS